MSSTITLTALTTELAYETGVDGKTGTVARHVTARLEALLNRKYSQLRSLVSQNGERHFRIAGSATAIPARTSGEDYIEVVWPAAAAEIVGVDVRLSGEWHELTKSSWATRRVDPGANRCNSPGEWTVLSMPQPSTTTVTAGAIAIWPTTLSGTSKVWYLEHWTDITSANVFVVFPWWQEWLLASAAQVIHQRDNNKRNSYEAARDRAAYAEAKILAEVRRGARGSVVARRRDGFSL